MNKQKIGKIIYFIFMFMLIASFASAQITLEIDKPKIYIGESMELRLVYENTDNKDAEIKGIENFDVVSSGRKIQTIITNGKKIKEDIEIYQIIPKKIGNFELIAINSKGEKSNKALIEVTDEVPVEKNSFFQGFREVEQRDYYLGEKIILKDGVKSRANLVGMMYLNNFEVEGAGIKNFNEARIKSEIVNENGVKYLVATAFEGVIEPFKSGKMSIPQNIFKLAYETSSNSFFNDTKEEYIPLKEIKLNILPLPQVNKPINFSGIVGTPKADFSLDRSEAKVGEGITMSLTLEGNANFASVDKIFDKEVEGFRIFEKVKSFDEGLKKDQYYGEKVFEIVFIPLREDLEKLPDIKISYFNIEKKEYSSMLVEGSRIKIGKSTGIVEKNKNTEEISSVETVKIRILPKIENGINAKHLIYILLIENIIIIILIFFLIRSKISRRKKKNSNKAFIGKFQKVDNIDEFYELLFDYIRENYNMNPESVNFAIDTSNHGIPKDLTSIVVETEEYKFQNKTLDTDIRAKAIDFLKQT